MKVSKFFAVFVAAVLVAAVFAGCSGEDKAQTRPTAPPTGESSTSATPAEGSQSPTPAPSATPGSIRAQRAGGMTHGSLTVGGVDRSFRVFIPFGLRENAEVPLVVALHGGLGSGDQFALTSRFEPLAQDQGFVVVFPDGIGATWTAGGCCGQASRTNVDDVGFLVALIDLIKREAPIDAGRVFMTGHSTGAMYRPEGDMKAIAMCCGLSILVHPAITYGLARGVFALDRDQLRSAVMTAAMAPGVNAYLFAHNYGVAKRVAASSVLIGTASSILTIWVWLHILP